MNLRPILLFAAATVLAATAHAHDCTGGTDGGMDATGNQCNDPVAGAPRAASPREQWRESGLAAYERGMDAEAVPYFRRAAEAGDARSAEMLALMYRPGSRLYPGISANAAESAKWAAVAAEARRREAAASIAAR